MDRMRLRAALLVSALSVTAACEPAGREVVAPPRRSLAGEAPRLGPTPAEATPPAPGAPAAPIPVRPATAEERSRYTWLAEDARVRPLEEVFPAPEGFARVSLPERSFGAWLRGLPMRAAGTQVRSYRGDVLHDGDDDIAAVAELDAGEADLQQCADSVIRLHAEWLWSSDRRGDIRYHATTGDLAVWTRYAAGERPKVTEQKMTWGPGARPDASRRAFRRYLDVVFAYAGSGSLAHRSAKRDRTAVAPGDFFVLPGSPGHAVLVLDLAEDASGKKVALLGQGYMPAQDFHVLTGKHHGWYSLDVDAVLTPFWPAPFPWTSLRRLPD
jgi:hypothetical protein